MFSKYPKHFLIFLLTSLWVLPDLSCQGDAPIVEISSGKIKGEEKESRDDRDFFAYRGIPYGKIIKRFEPAVKPDNWTGVRDAEEYGKECMQYSTYEKKVIGSEFDCLNINVFTPKVGDGLSKKLLPVMVFIQGSFMDGTADIYRAHYFLDQEVVIVTFNYRLNVFGFLSTNDEIIRGNMGLKDMILALQFLKENVRKFSGDPSKITIFGQGDGGVAVHLLMLSPLANGLFRKAITQSSSALKSSSIQTRPKEAAQKLARLVNCGKILNETENATKTSDCSFDNSTLIAECLRLVDAKTLAGLLKDSFSPLRDPLAFFGPVIEIPPKDSKDLAFLTEHPYSIISTGRQNRVPLMTGWNAQEGLITSGVILNNKAFVDKIDSHWTELSPRLLNYPWTRSDITNQIRRFYLNEMNYEFVPTSQPPSLNATRSPAGHITQMPTQVYPNLQNIKGQLTQPLITIPPLPAIFPLPVSTTTSAPEIEIRTINFEEQFQAFTDLFTDRFYAVPIFQTALLQSKYSPVYVYNNNYQGQYSMLDVYTGKNKEPQPAMKKVSNWFKKNILGKTVEAPKHMGVCNSDELILLFKYPDLKIKENTKDYQMSKDLISLWVQFAIDETKMTFHNTTWLPINPDTSVINVMKFGNPGQQSGFLPVSQSFLNRMKFWSNLKYLAPFDH